MSLADYEDFYYRACLCDRDDPVAAWREQSEEIEPPGGVDHRQGGDPHRGARHRPRA